MTDSGSIFAWLTQQKEQASSETERVVIDDLLTRLITERRPSLPNPDVGTIHIDPATGITHVFDGTDWQKVESQQPPSVDMSKVRYSGPKKPSVGEQFVQSEAYSIAQANSLPKKPGVTTIAHRVNVEKNVLDDNYIGMLREHMVRAFSDQHEREFRKMVWGQS